MVQMSNENFQIGKIHVSSDRPLMIRMILVFRAQFCSWQCKTDMVLNFHHLTSVAISIIFGRNFEQNRNSLELDKYQVS